MTIADWFWTGWNNASRKFYGPPEGVGRLRRTAYRIGWLMREKIN